MSRADQVLPEGWKPTRHSVVHLEASRDEPVPPDGLWRVFEHALGAGVWWLTPADDAARSWAATHRDQTTSGCLARHGRVMIPRGFRRPRPSDLSPDALRRVAGGAR